MRWPRPPARYNGFVGGIPQRTRSTQTTVCAWRRYSCLPDLVGVVIVVNTVG
jgi:hypothetical protein